MVSAHDLFFEVHCELPREAPGDDPSTERAYQLMSGLATAPRILDVGCGPGMQTLHLARISGGWVTAVDTHAPFLQQLERKAAQAGLAERIHTRALSMFTMDFAEPFDVIWSEGAIYIIGFEEGLQAWKKWLKPGGYLAVTELSWIRPDPPAEISAFWQGAYAGMSSVAGNLERLARQGYQTMGHFTLPDSAWWQNYYLPMQARIEMLRQKYAQDAAALKQLAEEQMEIDLFRRYSAWYGYEFFIAQV